MAADSDGTLTAVVICEGDLHDPEFPQKFKALLGKLKSILEQPKRTKKFIKVNKVEPWNSVRVTLSIPKEAAVKLRQLASEGSAALRALGILSVQLEDDTVISLRLVGQEIVLRTDNCSDASSGLSELTNILSQPPSTILPITTTSVEPDVPTTSLSKTTTSITTVKNGSVEDTTVRPIFKSPNTVCPMDGKLPAPVPPKVNDSRNYPFGSMTQARAIHRRENALGLSGVNVPPATQTSSNNYIVQPPPPPYPATTANIVLNKPMPSGSGNIAISSPLLVNLLQNEATITSQQQKHPTAIIKSGHELVLVGGSVGLNSNSTSVLEGDHELLTNKNITTLKQAMPVHQMHIKSQSLQSQTFVGGVTSNLILSSSSNSESLLSQQQQTIIQTNNMLSNSNSSISSAIVSQQPQSLPQTTIQQLNQSKTMTKLLVSGSNSGALATMSVPSSSNVNIKMQTRLPPHPLFSHQPQLRNAISLIQSQSSQNVQSSSVALLQKTQSQKFSTHSTLHNARFPLHHQVQQSTVAANTQSAPSGVRVNGPTPPLKPPQIGPTSSVPNPADTSNLQFAPQSTTSNAETMQAIQSSFGHRWTLKPMDSATKSSFQEFTRYQMQYNLSQQHQSWKADTMQSFADLDELTKNDLDSLLPSLQDGDLTTELEIDGIKAPLECIDTKDLVIGGFMDVSGSPSTSNSAIRAGSNTAETASNAKTSSGKERQFLINPLTAELEPMPSEESGDEIEEPNAFPEFNSEISNSIYSDDDNSCSTGFSKTASDRSDNERSSNSENSLKSKSAIKKSTEKTRNSKTPKEKSTGKSSLLKEKLQQGLKEKLYGKGKTTGKNKVKTKLNAISEPIENKVSHEKIKLRLKLEKSEPVTPAYKVDVSYVSSSPKRAQSSINLPTNIQAKIIQQPAIISSPTSSISSPTSAQSSPAGEELRVPPLHISLRGRNSVVIKNSKKDRKKSQSGGEEDDNSKKFLKNTAEDADDTTTLNHHYRLQEELSPSGSSTDIRIKMSLPEHIGVLHKQKHNLGEDVDVYVNNYIKITKQEQNGNTTPKSLEESEDIVCGVYKDGIKRSASDLVHSPNGALVPEKKRRLSHSSMPLTLSTTDGLSENVNDDTKLLCDSNDPYAYMKGPIGSTNVGTLPQHSSLLSTKSQKGNNNNNNAPFNKLQKSATKLKSKTPGSLTKDPGKTYVSESGIIIPAKITTVVPQGNMDAISEEKFKQKLLEPNFVTTKSSTHSTTSSLKVDLSPLLVTTTETKATSSATITSTAALSAPKISTAAQQIDTQAEEKRLPKCDVVDMANIATQRVRGSPGSQVQGEDSGIESMDALSEKSPHQSSSPQGLKRPESPKDVIRKPVDDFTNAVDIEAALAKMEGINELITPCDTKPDPPKRNGDPAIVCATNNTLAQSLVTTDKIVLCATSIEHQDLNNILIDDSIGAIENIIGPSKDLNENKECVANSLLDKQILDDCCNKDSVNLNAINAKAKNLIQCECDTVVEQELIKQLRSDEDKCVVKTEITPSQTTDSTKIENPIKSNSDCDRTGSSTEVIDDNNDNFKNKSSSPQPNIAAHAIEKQEVLNQLSIEIPTGDSIPRVRTRAASKLESPLEIQKTSPSESPACSVKSLKLSLAAIDRLSPKFIGKVTARKRQGSESSTQSSVSDDTPGKAKKIRKNFPIESTSVTTTDMETSTTLVTKSTVISNSIATKSNSNKLIDLKLVHVKKEESSDSDEPLIEIAGKVRNSKYLKADVVERVSRLIKSGSITPKQITQQMHPANNLMTGKITNLVVDDKASSISTRRSVRMTMAHGKGTGKCAVGGNGSNTTDELISKKNTAIQTGQKASMDQTSVGDARRKTRSAAGLDSTATEGRRRRGSRDSK